MGVMTPNPSFQRTRRERRAAEFRVSNDQRRGVDRSRGLAPEELRGRDYPNGDLGMGAREVAPLPPCPAQRLPANQCAREREERLVDVGPLVIPHTQAAKLIEPGKRPLDDPAPPA